MVLPKALQNGNWKTWMLGIVATIIATFVGNGILFQRETRETIAHLEERLKGIEGRGRDALIREFARHDQRMDNIVGVIGNMQNTIPTNTEVGQQLRERDGAIQRLERRVEELEKRR
jgi:hypothetical protein